MTIQSYEIRALDDFGGRIHWMPSDIGAWCPADSVRRLETDMEALRAELAALKASHITPCRWEQDMDGNWQTGCDNLYSFIDGTPTENGTKYCPFCGHHVEVHNVD